MKKKVSISYLYFLIPIFFFFFIDYSKEVDDVWFLLSHGRYVLSNGIPHTDFLTIHEGLHFVMQQWAFSSVLYFFYHLFGSLGVLFLIFSLNSLLLFFLYRLCMVISSSNRFASCIISAIIDTLLELNFILPRPQMVSFLLFVVLLYFLECFSKNDLDHKIYYLPLLSVLLVNFHAAMWLMFFIFCLPYVVEFIFLYWKKKDKRIIKLLFLLLLSFVVGFLNPYGYEAMFYSLSSYGVPVLNLIIREMHSFSLIGDYSLACNSLLLLLVLIVQIIVYFRNRHSYPIHFYFLFFGLSFMAFLNIRNLAFVLFGTLPFLVYGFSKDLSSLIPKWIFLFFFGVLFCIFMIQENRSFYTLGNPRLNGVVEYLNSYRKKDIRVFTYFNDGPYLEYHGYKVYMDTRAEVFLKKNNHKEEIMNEYYQVLLGKISFDEFIHKYSFSHFVVYKDTPIYEYLNQHLDYYSVVYQNKSILLYEKSR